MQEVHNCLGVLSEVFIKRTFESQLLLQVMIILLLVAQFTKHMYVLVPLSTCTVVVQDT